MKTTICLTTFIICANAYSFGQTDSLVGKADQIPNRVFNKIKRNASGLDESISKKTSKYLDHLAAKENSIKEVLYKQDSNSAKRIFGVTQSTFASIKEKLNLNSVETNPLHEYIPGIDSAQAGLRYLVNIGSKTTNISTDKLKSISDASESLYKLQSKLQQANDIDQLVKQREQQLKEQLQGYGLTKELAGINKEAYYYQQQLAEYKNNLHDPDKMEERVLANLRNIPSFRNFMQKNSYIGQLFGLPDNYSSVTSLTGLQTRSQVEKLVASNLGSTGSGGGVNPEQFAAQQTQKAQGLISQLKDKLKSLGNSGGNGDLLMPEGFNKNSQKTKTFLKRLEYGFDVQAQPSSSYFPATASLAVFGGYKLKDNLSIGLGLAYNLGLGTGFNHIRLSNQGIGIRSYVDAKIKGNIYFSGGIEYNYLQEFKSLQNIPDFDIWQKSALFGLSKKTKIGKNKESKVQILFDALYKQHIPQSSPVVFRIGYQF